MNQKITLTVLLGAIPASHAHACGGSNVVDLASLVAVCLATIPAVLLPLAGVIAGRLTRSRFTSLCFGVYAIASASCMAILSSSVATAKAQAALLIIAALFLVLPSFHYLWLACRLARKRRHS